MTMTTDAYGGWQGGSVTFLFLLTFLILMKLIADGGRMYMDNSQESST